MASAPEILIDESRFNRVMFRDDCARNMLEKVKKKKKEKTRQELILFLHVHPLLSYQLKKKIATSMLTWARNTVSGYFVFTTVN